MSNVSILPAKNTEIPVIRDLSLSHLTAKQKQKHFELNHLTDERFRNMVLGKGGICFVAHVKENIVGYVVGGPKVSQLSSIKYAELENVFVSDKYRNKGIANKLCKQFIDWAKGQGFERICVKTGWKKQTKLLPFYEKLGFSPMTIELEQDVK